MAGFSFAKSERLLKPAEFDRARRAGKRFSSRSFVFYVLAPNGLERRRLGLSVSARVGGAVKRNRIKRLIREFFRLNKDSFPQSADILVSVKSAAHIEHFSDIEEEFSKAPFFRKNPL